MVFGINLEFFLRGAHSYYYQGTIHEAMKMCPVSFHRQQWQISLPFHILQLVKPSPFHIPET